MSSLEVIRVVEPEDVGQYMPICELYTSDKPNTLRYDSRMAYGKYVLDATLANTWPGPQPVVMRVDDETLAIYYPPLAMRPSND
jgi:hypothetical protein